MRSNQRTFFPLADTALGGKERIYNWISTWRSPRARSSSRPKTYPTTYLAYHLIYSASRLTSKNNIYNTVHPASVTSASVHSLFLARVRRERQPAFVQVTFRLSRSLAKWQWGKSWLGRSTRKELGRGISTCKCEERSGSFLLLVEKERKEKQAIACIVYVRVVYTDRRSFLPLRLDK